MSKRVRLTADIAMQLDGQPQIVLSGSVIDIPDSLTLVTAHATVLAEAAAAVTKATSVRSIRTR